ncbi:hypothetical protein [Aporhodopirellula aestuarii]|uniref:Uncharacterized protein n=1 Tax=Aporhodopirellula aestuarii TaxID=2950107 RepID=A0ABT0TZC0_9BACT|nr:hypothetical protein [Aporhodopirellula aestuarii]MCM2369959.1 hypothetical protein [Aporhodopirellula aestuarii]
MSADFLAMPDFGHDIQQPPAVHDTLETAVPRLSDDSITERVPNARPVDFGSSDIRGRLVVEFSESRSDVVPRLRVGVLSRSDRPISKPASFTRGDLSRDRADKPAWEKVATIRLSEIKGIDGRESKDRNVLDGVTQDRAPIEGDPFDPLTANHIPIRLVSLSDLGLTLPGLTQRGSDGRNPIGGGAQWEAVLATTSLSSWDTASSTSADDLLERAISTIARDHAQASVTSAASIPSQSGRAFSMSLQAGNQERSDAASLLSPPLNEGGMIEIESLRGADAPIVTPAESEDEEWRIERSTIERLTETAQADVDADIAEASSNSIIDESGNGGLIAISLGALPRSATASHGQPIDVQLDPSIGHFRSFQLAASPGHDRESLTPVDFLAMARSGLEAESEGVGTVQPVGLSSVAYAGVVFVSGVVLTVELRGRKSDDSIEQGDDQIDS